MLDTFYRATIRRLKKIIKSDYLILDVGSLNSPYTAYFYNAVVAIDNPNKERFGYSGEVLEELKTDET